MGNYVGMCHACMRVDLVSLQSHCCMWQATRNCQHIATLRLVQWVWTCRLLYQFVVLARYYYFAELRKTSLVVTGTVVVK